MENQAGSPGQDRHIDWKAVEDSPEFQELTAKRRLFVVPATVFFLVWYCGFIALAGYAEGFMGESVYQGLTVGYVLALTQFAMVGILGIAYLRYSERVLDPLREQASLYAVTTIDEVEPETAASRSRFERGEPRVPAEVGR